jgi:hypothetical protein
MPDLFAQTVQLLQGVHGGSTQTLRAHTRAAYAAGGPSIQIESAEGITTFPQLSGDEESMAARAFINGRVVEITEAQAAASSRPAA